MANQKPEINKIIDKYRPMFKKFGAEVGEAAKKGEESVVTMSKIFKIQMDMFGLNLQKEKLYHEIGKEVAGKLLKDSLDVADLEKYRKDLVKLQSAADKKKRDISKVKVSSGKQKTGKKK